jgi:hypothetical protein
VLRLYIFGAGFLPKPPGLLNTAFEAFSGNFGGSAASGSVSNYVNHANELPDYGFATKCMTDQCRQGVTELILLAAQSELRAWYTA